MENNRTMVKKIAAPFFPSVKPYYFTEYFLLI